MKLPNRYIAIDIETTDVSPAKGDIIQIGAVVIEKDFTIGQIFDTYIKPQTTWRNPEAMAVNGIPEVTLENAPPAHVALKAFEMFAIRNAGGRPILSAWASYFDVEYLKAYYARLGRNYPFSFKNIDLKTIAIWEASKRDQDASGGLSAFLERQQLLFEGTPHDGLDDIINSVRLIQSYIK